MRFSATGRVLAHALADALFPPRCAACGVFLGHTGRRPRRAAGDQADMYRVFDALLGGTLCPGCRKGFEGVTSPLCPCCGVMFPSRRGADHLCGRCAVSGHWFSAARAVGTHEGPLREMIHHLKYGGCVQLARPLGRLLYAFFRRTWTPEDVDLVMPVPLHGRRQRRRGFNQAWLLVRQWPGFAEAPAGGHPGPLFVRNALVRRTATRPQTGLGREERLSNLKGAFALAPGASVDNRTVLLVDDVMTTGATADACARVLRAAGARRVDVLTLARAMG